MTLDGYDVSRSKNAYLQGHFYDDDKSQLSLCDVTLSGTAELALHS